MTATAGSHAGGSSTVWATAPSMSVRVHLEELRSGPQLTALTEGRLDVALLYGRPSAPDIRSRSSPSTPA